MGQHIRNEGGDLFHLCGKYHPRGRLTDRQTDRLVEHKLINMWLIDQRMEVKREKGPLARSTSTQPPFDHLHFIKVYKTTHKSHHDKG